MIKKIIIIIVKNNYYIYQFYIIKIKYIKLIIEYLLILNKDLRMFYMWILKILEYFGNILKYFMNILTYSFFPFKIWLIWI